MCIPLRSGKFLNTWTRTSRMRLDSLNPFEVREVLQVHGLHDAAAWTVSIPLKSGRCCKAMIGGAPYLMASQSLWSQGGAARDEKILAKAKQYVSIPLKSGRCCKINVLNGILSSPSQSLWRQGGAARAYAAAMSSVTGLNPFEGREVLQGSGSIRNVWWIVSIPLKAGRCCKKVIEGNEKHLMSQSLWRQGGAARVLYKTISLKSKRYLLICVKFFLTKSNFPKFCKERVFVPLLLETSQHIATNHGHCHGSSLSFFLIFVRLFLQFFVLNDAAFSMAHTKKTWPKWPGFCYRICRELWCQRWWRRLSQSCSNTDTGFMALNTVLLPQSGHRDG